MKYGICKLMGRTHVDLFKEDLESGMGCYLGVDVSDEKAIEKILDFAKDEFEKGEIAFQMSKVEHIRKFLAAFKESKKAERFRMRNAPDARETGAVLLYVSTAKYRWNPPAEIVNIDKLLNGGDEG